MKADLLITEIRTEEDLVLVRQRARQIAELLGFAAQDQTRIATAVSEVARNAFQYAGGGRASFAVEGEGPAAFVIRVTDSGPGLADLESILSGQYKSKSGLGRGLVGARLLMDGFHLASVVGKGTTVELGKTLPPVTPGQMPALLAKVAQELSRRVAPSPMEEVRYQNQELLQVLADARQTTDRLQKAEKEREGFIAGLQQTAHFNEMFVGILGHDLRNPLSAITTAASLVLMRAETDRISRPTARIIASAERMARMIDQVLDFTRIRLGAGLPLEAREMDLGESLTEIVSEFQGEGSKQQIQYEYAGNLIGSWDRDRLAQVSSNLLGNARHHGLPDAPIVLEVDGRSPDFVEVRVKNRGAIPLELLPVIFEPLQMGTSRRPGSKGLGLGLFIAQQIAAAHGGSLGVESTDASGTTFTLRLPRTPQATL